METSTPVTQLKRNSNAPSCSDGIDGLAKVGSFAPNGYGLYDMIGNLSELGTSCDIIRCDPKYLLGGNYTKSGVRLEGGAIEQPARASLKIAGAESTVGLRVVLDFKNVKDEWADLERDEVSNEKDAWHQYYEENPGTGDGAPSWIDILEEVDPELAQRLKEEIVRQILRQLPE